jgi:protoheme IX farnesyltransferase
MCRARPDSMNRFQKLALTTAVATIVLFAVGGLVRGTGSGLGCSTWPECTPGRLFPAGTVHSLIEFSHRFLVFVVSVLVVATAVVAWRQHRHVRSLVWPAIAAIPLVFGQAVLGGIVVHTELNPWWVTIHFAVALAFVADVIFVATNALSVATPPREGGDAIRGERGFAGLALIATGATGALLLVGTYVRARSAGLAFVDWPLMNGRLVPALGGATTAMFAHRILAASVFLLVLWVAIRARTMAARSKDLVVLSTLTLCLFMGQIVSGALNVWTRLRPWAVVLHVALSVLIWATLVALATVSRRPAVAADPLEDTTVDPDGDTTQPDGGSLRDTIIAYVRLTKPRIIVLLLITTVPAMMLAAQGIPSLGLMLATLVGGTVAAGSANAINMYLDRDIDEIMRRTKGRPLPAHTVTPDRALRFGFVLGAASYFFLSIAVNVLAATLASRRSPSTSSSTPCG